MVPISKHKHGKCVFWPILESAGDGVDKQARQLGYEEIAESAQGPRNSEVCWRRAAENSHGAWGIGHGALGIEHGALGMEHWALRLESC